ISGWTSRSKRPPQYRAPPNDRTRRPPHRGGRLFLARVSTLRQILTISSNVTLSPLSIVGGFRKSARPVLLASTLVAILLAGGCASRGPSQKEIARANWNEARARVLLNLASDQFKHGNLVDARKTTNDALKLSDRVAGVYVLKAKLDIE